MYIHPYYVEVPVRFSDTDAYGIVHHSNFYCWLEESRFLFFDKLMKESIDCLMQVQYKFPVIESHCKYIKSISYPEKVSIEMIITIKKSAKIHFEYVVFNSKNEKCAKAFTEHVYMINERVLLNHPEEFKKIVLRYNDERKYFVLE